MKNAFNRELAQLLTAVGAGARLLVRAQHPHDALPELLALLGAAVGADRSLYMPIHSQGRSASHHQFSVSHEWVSDPAKISPLTKALGPAPTPFIGPDYDFSRRLELLLAGLPVVYGSVRVLPRNETSLANKLGTRSAVRVPVQVKGALVAMLGLDHVMSLRPWRGDELHALWLCAELIGRALEGFGDGRNRAPPTDNATANPGIAVWVRDGVALFEPSGWRATLPKLLRELGATYDLRRATWWDERFGAVRLTQEWSTDGVAPLPSTLRDPGLPAAAETYKVWTERNRCYIAARNADRHVVGYLVLQSRRKSGASELPAAGLLDPLAELLSAAIELAARRGPPSRQRT